MKQKVITFFKHPFIASGFIVFAGTMGSNVLNYLFNLILGKFLEPSDFGTFSSLNSLTYLIYIPATTLMLVMTKYVSEKKANDELHAVSHFFKYLTQYLFIFGLIVFLFFLIFSSTIAKFLNIADSKLLVITGVTFVIIFPLSALRGVMNGLLHMGTLSVNLLVEAMVRVILVFILLIIGFGVVGGIVSPVASSVAAYILGVVYIKKTVIKRDDNNSTVKDNKIKWRKMTGYAFPVFVTLFFMNGLYTNDIVLAKHFLSPKEAGLYSAIALTGKIVFFGSSFLSGLLFPFVANAHARGESGREFLTYTLAVTALIAFAITAIFYLVPNHIIFAMFGKNYISIAPYLPIFGLFMSLVTISYVFMNFFLSTSRTKAVILPIIASLIQVIGILIRHNSIEDIIIVNVISSATLIFLIMLYSFLFIHKKSFSHD